MRRLTLLLVVLALLTAFSTVVIAQEAESGYIEHVVQPGQNLFRISLQYNVSMSAIASANGIQNINIIYAGTTLKIPTAGATTPPAETPPETEEPAPSTTYTVVRGDTLSRIAARFGTTWQQIVAINKIANPNLIYPGTVLTISGTAPADDGSTSGGDTTTGGTTTPPVSTAFELGGQVISFAYPSQMTGAGMTWAKIQVHWNQGEGPEIAQGAIDAAHSRGFKVLLSVIGSKQQLAANPTQFYKDFATFLGGVAGLGADGIEVWNEMNIDREWPSGLISGVQYTSMLSNAYQAIKAANPNTLVVSGAPAPTGFFGGCSTAGCDDDKFIAQMAQAGASNYMDCVGVHYNAGVTSPDTTSGAPVGSSSHYSWYYPSMVNVYAAAFPGKPLCFTELGYLTGDGFSQPLPAGFSWAGNTTIANQAEWLALVVTRARQRGGIKMVIVWNVDATDFGDDPMAGYAIVRPDGTCPACNTLSVAMK